MQMKRLPVYLLATGVVLLITVGIFFLLPTQRVSAQCGSQASSCKNCHETQAKDPVNNDKTAWHTSHAFGDFCYLCHGGNNTATDETAAHTGMVDPLKDIVSACKSCHASDYQAKAQIYATTLGVTISAGAAAPTQPASQPATTPTPAAAAAPTAAPAAPAAAIPAANMVDYTQRYNESVLGQNPVNVGDVILTVMIAAMLFGGGYFILRREGWVSISFQDTKQIQATRPVPEGYPTDVVDMVPDLAKLKPDARRNLRQILAKPGTAAELFASIVKLIKPEDAAAAAKEDEPKG
ncbi:MAG: hypothetical protein ABSA01_08275 [Anaerolineales bacterium]|jgi:hypothetical protein